MDSPAEDIFIYVCVVCTHVCAQVCPALWTVAHQAPLSMEFSKQEYWSGVPFPSRGDLPHPRIKPLSPASPALIGDPLQQSHPGITYV